MEIGQKGLMQQFGTDTKLRIHQTIMYMIPCTDTSLFSRLFSFPSYSNWIEFLLGLNQTLPLILFFF